MTFRVRLTPKGGCDAIEGWRGQGVERFLKARVRAAPEDGEANAALIALLANVLALPKSSLAIVAGHKARLKTVAAVGDTARLADRLKALGEAP